MVRVRNIHPVKSEAVVDLDDWANSLKCTEFEREEYLRAAKLVEEVQYISTGSRYVWGDEGDCLTAGLGMAEILIELHLDAASISAAILYRAIREERLSLDKVKKLFDTEVLALLDGVTQMAAIGQALHPTREVVLGQSQTQVDTIRRMLVTMIDDVRVALIKLAERNCALHALKNEPVKRRQVAKEVSEVYAPLAHRLGIGYLKWELEDLAFRYLEPDSYMQIAKLLDGKRRDREKFLSVVQKEILAELKAKNVNGEVQGRVKHIYSIWRKMQRKGISFSEVYDIRAVRILVNDLQDCYGALGVVHTKWRNIPREFDDYIANPKNNGYQSLHTAVIGPEGKALEIQIRTYQMHTDAEFGVCAHWAYKGADKKLERQDSYEQKIDWLRQVLEWHEELGEVDALGPLTSEVAQDRIYVFTPKGHVVDLPEGSTSVDFAYHIHTEVGHKCRGAKVDGRIVPLTYHLKTGERVEILSSNEAKPSRDWLRLDLGYSRSSRTRSKIQQWFRLQAKDTNLDLGRSVLEREFKRMAMTSVDIKVVADKMNCQSVEVLYISVGSGDITAKQVMAAAQRLIDKTHSRQLDFSDFETARTAKQDAGIKVQGVGNLLTVIAGCCNPVPGDDIAGYITHGRGVSVHRGDCGKLLNLQKNEPGRIVLVEWGQSAVTFIAHVAVEAVDRQGLLRDITTLLSNDRVNVIGMNTMSDTHQHTASMKLTVEVKSVTDLSRLLSRLSQLPNIVSVQRITEN
jgi:GTP pyrophosphokinase